uniref:Secreted protein n=1 Tax=Anopheles arabiensis TaxID=7173 RepID=A0A8W7M926_ANOAR
MLNWKVFLFVAVAVFLFVQFDTAESSPFNDLQPTGRPATAGQALKNILQRAIGDNSSDESKPSAGSSEELGRIYYG